MFVSFFLKRARSWLACLQVTTTNGLTNHLHTCWSADDGLLRKKIVQKGLQQCTQPVWGQEVTVKLQGILEDRTVVEKDSKLVFVIGEGDVHQVRHEATCASADSGAIVQESLITTCNGSLITARNGSLVTAYNDGSITVCIAGLIMARNDRLITVGNAS